MVNHYVDKNVSLLFTKFYNLSNFDILYINKLKTKIKYSETLMAALPKVQPFLPITLQAHTDQISFQQCESDEQTIQQQPRSLNPTLLNKSSIHCVNISDKYLLEFPQIDKRVQRLDIYSNLLCQFPTGLYNLKQINISSNKINRFPSNLEDLLPCLRIIKANNNCIGIIPLLLQIRHLQLRQNPIKLITTRLSQSRLQYLDFDWIPYLINTIFYNVNPLKNTNDQQQILYALYDLIEKASKAEAALLSNTNNWADYTETSTNIGIANQENQQKLVKVDTIITKGEFIGFDSLFQCSRNNGLTIQYLLHKAVNNNADFFIQFLRDWQAGINYNSMQYASKPILEQVLSLKYSKALQLFQIRKSNLSQPEIYMTNLLLSCRYINADYFNYLTKNGLKRHIIQQNSPLIIQTILKSYDSQLGSDRMLRKILQLANFNNDNKFTFALPYDYDFSQAECLAQAISDIMKDQQGLAQYFNFYTALQDQVNQKQNQFLAMMQRGKRQPLLHFAMKMRKPELVKKILQTFQKPFIKNFENKGARGIRGSMFSRKLVWKYEKKCIEKHFEESDVINESPSKSKMRESRFLQIFYNKKQETYLEDAQKTRQCQYQKIHKILQKKTRKINLLQNHEKQDYQKQKAHEERKSQQERQEKPIINAALTATKQLKRSYLLNKCESPITNKSEQPILKFINLHQKLDNLALYESYHGSQLSLIMRDYDPVPQEMQKNKVLSFYSPFHMCRDVDLQDDRDHQFYTVIQSLPENIQGAPLQKSRSGNSRMCMNACLENEMQVNIVNSS